MSPSRRNLLAALLCALPFAIIGDNRADAFLLRGGVALANAATPLTASQFTLTNWNGAASSPGFMRFGMPFKQGDIPSGSTASIYKSGSAIPCQFDQRTFYGDGSLKFAVCSIRDTTFSASESRTYVPYVVPSSSWNNTGPIALSTVTGAQNFQVLFSSVTQYNGSTNVARGSGAFTANFNTIINQTVSGQATRLTCVHSGPVCQTWMAWGMAIDSGLLTADPDLKAYVYITVWNDGSNGIGDIEYAAVMSQDWWTSTASTKYLLNYNASLQNGATVIQAYNTVAHPYHSTWMTATMTADNNVGRRFWMNQIPTIGYGFNQAYWVSSGLAPPMNYGASITFGTNPYTTTTYTPCGGMNVNVFIDNTGGSNGRGLFMDSDCWAFLSQRQNDVRIARVSALSGLGVPYHRRSSDNRTRPQDSGVADLASTPMSLTMVPNSSSFYTFTSQGMPAPVEAYYGSATTSTYLHGYQTPTGGSGVWTPSANTSHASMYCYFLYLLEGERHWLDCLGDLCNNGVQQQNGNSFAGRPTLLYYTYTEYQTTFSIPSTVYSAINNMLSPNNTRATGWALMLNAITAGMYPQYDALGNDTPEQPYFAALNTQNNNYCAQSMLYMPASQLSAGWWIDESGVGQGCVSPWMHAFIGMGAYTNYQMTGDANALAMGNYIANHAINNANAGLYLTTSYRQQVTPISGTAGAWNPSTNDYFSGGIVPMLNFDCTITTGTNVVATAASPNGTTFQPTGVFGPAIANGDLLYLAGCNFNLASAGTLPSELTQGTPYYVVNYVSATDFQISASSGGSPISFASSYTNVFFSWIGASLSAYTLAQNPPYLPAEDSYSPINRCLLAYAKRNGKSGAAAALTANQAFLVTVDNDNYSAATGQFWDWQMAA